MREQEKINRVISSVRNEYDVFKTEMLKNGAEKVFENHSKIHFYCHLNDYFDRDISDFGEYEKSGTGEYAILAMGLLFGLRRAYGGKLSRYSLPNQKL